MTIAKNTYMDYKPAGQGAGVLPIVENLRVLEIGFGSGDLLNELCLKGNDVYGTDVGKSIVEKARTSGFKNVFHVDASEQSLPFDENFFDAIYCYEVFEHLTNPHRLFFEIRRVLKPEHNLYFSVPTQEKTMGYGPCRHSFVYPGLLERKNLERFFMQMYFKTEHYEENAEGIIYHRNYILKNMKQPDKPDIMKVIIGDYSVPTLYEDILKASDMHVEIEREIEPYIEILEEAGRNKNWQMFNQTMNTVVSYYSNYYPLYIKLAEILELNGNHDGVKVVLERLREIPGTPEELINQIDNIMESNL
jgi:ubiquinone/menaquinone biosynthesis C-methylase UbiE